MPLNEWLDALDDPEKAKELVIGEEETSTVQDLNPGLISEADENQIAGLDRRELVVDSLTGEIKQAGSDQAGSFIRELKEAAEKSLYVFVKVILGRDYLSPSLHIDVCDWLQNCPPNRKLLMLPREHCKSTIVSQGLPLHILIQPKESNLYFPGQDGCDQRIVLACETESRSKDHMLTIIAALETNKLIRGLWPHRCWDNPRRQARRWNALSIDIPRNTEYADPTLRALGVDGAITGAHPTCLIKDDLISKKAANSPTTMRSAIEWHKLSRMLINKPEALEFIIGTHWGVGDIYDEIEQTDPTVEIIKRSVVEDGIPIYPEAFTLELVEAKKREQGPRMFTLQFMNTAIHPELSDFDQELFRYFTVTDGKVCFESKEDDLILSERVDAVEYFPATRGDKLNRDTYNRVRNPRVKFKLG